MSGTVLTVGWERPQFTVRIGSTGEPLRADAFSLVRADRSMVRMPPTGSRRDGDILELRFNVTVGPGIRALRPGRWRLRVTDEDGEGDHPVCVADTVDLAEAARAFAIPQGVYRVTPLSAPSDGGLFLDVSLEVSPTSRRPGIRGRLGRARRSLLDGPRWTRLVFAPMRAIRRRTGRRILFVSGSPTALARNMKLVHDRMVARGLDRDLTLLRRRGGRYIPWRERLATLWALAGADVILVEGSRQTVIYMVDLAPEVRFIQLWHASGAFKTVRYSQLGKPNGPDPWSRSHRNYTHAIVSSQADVPFYAEGFGIPEERVIPTGIPRMDRFFDDQGQALGRAAAYAAYPEAEGRMTILFAPTYRDAIPPKDGQYPLEILDYEALHALATEKDAIVIIKMHPFARTDLGIPEPFRDRLLDGFRASIDVNDLLFAVDLLITDYSSIVFEYSTLGRPMLFFAYDLDEYIATRDFYVPFETFVPGRIVRTFPELLDAIRRDDYQVEKVAAFAARHFAHHDNGSSDRVIDQLVLRR